MPARMEANGNFSDTSMVLFSQIEGWFIVYELE